MGNDIAVFQEGELEESFYRYHGPKNESWSEFFNRTYSGIMNMLIQPKRYNYNTSDLLVNNTSTSYYYNNSSSLNSPLNSPNSSNSLHSINSSSNLCDEIITEENDYYYHVNEFKLTNYVNNNLNCVTWIENNSSKLWILYLHTNTRSLVDAKEILPLCKLLGANLISFDLPGCGKSEGNLSFSMISDLSIVISHFLSTYHDCELIIWARGMSTALVIEYLNNLQKTQDEHPEHSVTLSIIKYIVLDSPFLSVKKMVADASQTITAYGVTVPSVVISFCGSFIRRSVKSQLGSDPYDVQPIQFVPNMTIPCSILSARNDDYMPPHHGQSIYEVWGQSITPKPFCEFDIYNGRHFGIREKDIVCKPYNSILNYVNYRPKTVEEQLLSSENQLINLTTPNNGVFLFPGAGMLRIPSNSSLASKGSL